MSKNNERIEPYAIEGAQLLGGQFKNFSGKPGQFNPAGKRTFAIRLDRKTADDMSQLGWNVKQLDPREEGDEPIPFITARLRFDNFPPTVYMLTGRNNKKTRLDEDTIGLLDASVIEWADIVLSPYCWETATGSGVTAYVKTMYVKVQEDAFASKYDDYED